VSFDPAEIHYDATEPRPVQVMQQAAYLLSAIGADSTWFSPGPPFITDRYRAPQDWTEHPVLCVVPGPGWQVDLRQLEEFSHRFVFTVWGAVKGDDALAPWKLMIRLWYDVRRALLGARSGMAGLVTELMFTGPPETDEGTFDPIAAFAQDVVVSYYEEIPDSAG
jgi:hypothetical protein